MHAGVRIHRMYIKAHGVFRAKRRLAPYLVRVKQAFPNSTYTRFRYFHRDDSVQSTEYNMQVLYIYIIIYTLYIYRQGYPKRRNDHRRGCKVRVYSKGTHVHTQVQYIICLAGHTSYYNCHDIDYHVEVESTESIHLGW